MHVCDRCHHSLCSARRGARSSWTARGGEGPEVDAGSLDQGLTPGAITESWCAAMCSPLTTTNERKSMRSLVLASSTSTKAVGSHVTGLVRTALSADDAGVDELYFDVLERDLIR